MDGLCFLTSAHHDCEAFFVLNTDLTDIGYTEYILYLAFSVLSGV